MSIQAITPSISTGAEIAALIAAANNVNTLNDAQFESIGSIESFFNAPGDVVNVSGADNTGQVDCTELVNTQLATYGQVYFSTGTYRVDGMINPPSKGSITLGPDVHLIRKSTESSNTDPLILLDKSECRLIGSGMSSRIETENSHLIGVVSIGSKTMDVNLNHVNDCKADSFEIIGSVADDTSGNVGLYMAGPQLDNAYTSYFHLISNIKITNATTGLALVGWPDGCHITNMHYYRTSTAVLMAGCVDNVISGLFHHTSPNGVTIRVTDYDNTAVEGGRLHTTIFNSVTGIVCEQTGATAKSLVVETESLAHNVFFVRSNVSGGWTIPDAAYEKKNTFFVNDHFTVEKIFSRFGSLPTSVVDAGGEVFESAEFFAAFGDKDAKRLYQKIRIDNFTGAPADTEDHPTYELNLIGGAREWIRK